MDIQKKKETLPTNLPPSSLLARKARLEMKKTGKISMVCPICKEHPKITTTSHGERTTVSCKCKNIFTAEINF